MGSGRKISPSADLSLQDDLRDQRFPKNCSLPACIDSSQQSKSISCLTPVFFDRSDNICCLISMISEHSSAQPIVKPAALIYHCPTCSRPPSTILYRTLQHMAQTDTPPCSIG